MSRFMFYFIQGSQSLSRLRPKALGTRSPLSSALAWKVSTNLPVVNNYLYTCHVFVEMVMYRYNLVERSQGTIYYQESDDLLLDSSKWMDNCLSLFQEVRNAALQAAPLKMGDPKMSPKKNTRLESYRFFWQPPSICFCTLK